MGKTLLTVIDIIARQHFLTVILIVVYGFKLYDQKKTKDVELKYFWTTQMCCAMLVLEDIFESLSALDPRYRFFRVFFSVAGYALRPAAAVGLLLVVCPPEKRSWKIWILCTVNTLIYMTAFFSPLAFSFDEEYSFTRGPLFYTIYVVSLLYMIQVFVVTWKRFYDRNPLQRWSLIISAASCIVAALIDGYYGGCRLNEAIMISSIFFFIFLRSHDSRLDPLTSLGNRFAFYDDIEHERRNISAIASLDMNGLKGLNDNYGHAEGDKALREIGASLAKFNSRSVIAYRVGGDEFVIVFLRQEEMTVAATVSKMREEVRKAGYSISAGYAMREKGEDIDEVLRLSDGDMYRDKREYYEKTPKQEKSR